MVQMKKGQHIMFKLKNKEQQVKQGGVPMRY